MREIKKSVIKTARWKKRSLNDTFESVCICYLHLSFSFIASETAKSNIHEEGLSGTKIYICCRDRLVDHKIHKLYSNETFTSNFNQMFIQTLYVYVCYTRCTVQLISNFEYEHCTWQLSGQLFWLNLTWKHFVCTSNINF